MGKLTDEQIQEVIKCYENGMTFTDMAEKFNTSRTTIKRKLKDNDVYSMDLSPKKCAYCQTEFTPSRYGYSQKKYCSNDCRHNSFKEDREPQLKICEHCNNEFYKMKSYKKYCSENCSVKASIQRRQCKKRRFRKCQYCNKFHYTGYKYCSADSIDKELDKALREIVGTIRGITTRNDLLNVNVSYDMNINYRLVELGFITSKKDMDYIKNNLQKFTKRIAEGIHGKAIGGTPAGSSKKTTWDWKGRFTANTLIKVRKSASIKGTIVNKGSWIKANQWVDFVSVTKKDGYWWIKFKYPTNPNAGYFYCAVCKITDKNEKIKKEKYWGKIKWK